jgi:hypothetical protein
VTSLRTLTEEITKDVLAERIAQEEETTPE